MYQVVLCYIAQGLHPDGCDSTYIILVADSIVK